MAKTWCGKSNTVWSHKDSACKIPDAETPCRVLCASQQTVKSETQRVNGILGQSLSFPERVFKTGYLRYGEDTNAFVLNGQSQIDPGERFKNRLPWDNATGLFSLSDLQIEDAGVYSVGNKDGKKRTPQFNLTLHCTCVCARDVSKPQVTGCDSSSCRAVCSVDNKKEVTLTSYRGEEILNQTSSPDLTTDLSLRLEVEGKNYNSTYSCVAANPVSNETVPVPKCCSEDGHPKETDKSLSSPEKPHGANIPRRNRFFNYHLSRARLAIECTFGILASKWRMYRRVIGVHPANTEACV
ncbi:SLAM family member 5-like [Salvelinus alpinus]